MDFWTSTFDEVLLVIQGKVDEWRILRNNAYLIYCSLPTGSKMDMYKVLPLPYDTELSGGDVSDLDLYEQGKLIRLPNVKYNG